jgi:uncharacterized protein with HEPN domain
MKGDQLYLKHILEAIEKIESYISVVRDVFMTTTHWQDAVIRQLEIISEATKRLSHDLRSQHHEILWPRTARCLTRNSHDSEGDSAGCLSARGFAT